MKYLKTFENYDETSIGANEFHLAYNWINEFGGKKLLYSKNIIDGHGLLNALKNKKITIAEIDEATVGKNGQVGDIPFSKTHIAKTKILPYLNDTINESLPKQKSVEQLKMVRKLSKGIDIGDRITDLEKNEKIYNIIEIQLIVV
jgi:hypothetical protein